MKKVLLFLFSLAMGVAIFIWVGRTVGWQGIKDAFSILTGWHGLVIFALTLIIMLVSNWRWSEILRGEGVNIPFWRLFGTWLSSFTILYLAPILIWGGELFRGYVLKEKNQVPWPKAMASVIIDRILEWTFNLVFLFAGVLFFIYKIGFPSVKSFIIVVGALLILFFALCFFYFKAIKKESIAKAVGKIFFQKLDGQPLDTEKEIFDFFKSKNRSMWRALLLSFLRVVAMYLRVWVLLIFLGESVGILSALSVLGFSFIAVMIPIPASLGSHEAIQTFAFKSLGLDISSATVFTMLIRATEIIFALFGIIILLRIWASLIKNILLKKVEKFTIKQ